MLTLCSPLIFIGFMVPLFTPWMGISGVQEMFEDVQGNVHTTCMSNHFIQITRGVCNRGTYEAQTSKNCSYWTETSQWEELDAKNAALVAEDVDDSIVSDTVSDADNWYTLEVMVITCIALSGINMMFFFFLTADWEAEHEPDEDIEYRVIQISGGLSIIMSILCAITLNYTFNNSDIANGKTWRTKDCKYVSTPTLGFFLFAFGCLCCLTSVFYSTLCIASINFNRRRLVGEGEENGSDSESDSSGSEGEENGLKASDHFDDIGNEVRGAAGTRTAASYHNGGKSLSKSATASTSAMSPVANSSPGKMKTASSFLKNPVQPLSTVTDVSVEMTSTSAAVDNSRPSSSNSKLSHVAPANHVV